MKKADRVKSNILFNEIIKKGKKVGNKQFTIFFVENKTGHPLFGISAPKKLGNAVVRNKLKRQTRALLHETKLLFKKDRNYIIIVKEAFLSAPYASKMNALKRLIGDINEK